ncbi:MAG: flagellar assembly protein FliW [Candidatus Eisenbacteria bacterium]
MMVVRERTGPVDAAEGRRLEFDRGIFGFEDVDAFILRPLRDGSPLRVLRAAEGAEPVFAVIDPFILDPEYRFVLGGEDRMALEWTGETDLTVMVVVGIPADPNDMTANMKGPIVIHPAKGLGRQVILLGEEYPARLRVMDAVGRRRDGIPGGE